MTFSVKENQTLDLDRWKSKRGWWSGGSHGQRCRAPAACVLKRGDLTRRRPAVTRWSHGSLACRRSSDVPSLWRRRGWLAGRRSGQPRVWRRRCGGLTSQRPWLRAHRPRGSLPRPWFQGAARSGSLIQFSFVFPRRTRPASPPVSGIRPLFSVQRSPRCQHCQAPACPAIGAAHHPVAGGSREHLYVAQSVSACGRGLCIFSFSFSFLVQDRPVVVSIVSKLL